MNKFVVIGAGPAGESAARVASKKGARVQLLEKENLGGLCLNRGCVPSKTLLAFGKKCFSLRQGITAKYFNGPKNLRQEFWREIGKEKDRVVQTLRDHLKKTFQLHKIEILSGSAEFISPQELKISSANGASSLLFDKAIVAVGSLPIFPPPFQEFQKDLLDSDRILELEELSQNWLVVGGGAVGSEYACLLHSLGCAVTLLELKEQLLPGEDPNISQVLRKSFEKRGIQVLTNTKAESLRKNGNRWDVHFSSGALGSFDQILVCVGRRPNGDSIHCEKAQIKISAKGVDVDATLCTSNPNVYAIGDVNGLSLLAHAGSVQGEIAALNALDLNSTKRYDAALIPRCLYTWPEVASVGMWLSEAKKLGFEVKSQRYFFEANARALAEDAAEGFLQIVSEKESGKILGAQMVGPHVTEIIHILSVAISQGLKRSQLREVVFAHPTLSEGIRTALEK